MRICMICGEFPPVSGGVGSYVYNLSKNLISMGNEVTVFTRGNHKGTEIVDVEGIKVYRVAFYPLYPFHIKPHGILINKEFRSLENTFDIVHFHSPIIPTIKTKIPSIVTEHGTVKGFIKNLELTDLFSLIQKVFSPIFTYYDKKVIYNSIKITAVSQSSADEIKEYYNVNKNISIVYNGVDTNYFSPKKNNENNFDYILYTGALVSKKGVIDVINCAKYVIRDFPDIKFIIVGKGPLEKHLKNLSKINNLDENVIFTGYVSKKKLLSLYQNALIYVFPSYYEGLPTVLLEAMSCGIPVVASDIPQNKEIIKEGIGITTKIKNPKELSSHITFLIRDIKLRENIGNNARKHILDNYDWKIISKKFVEIYNELLAYKEV